MEPEDPVDAPGEGPARAETLPDEGGHVGPRQSSLLGGKYKRNDTHIVQIFPVGVGATYSKQMI